MKTKRILSLLLAFMTVLGIAVSAAPASEASPYKDVKTTRWSYADIMYVTENGLMNGTSADKFAPAETMTRAMVVTVLYRLQGEPKIQFSTKFSDVKANKWYSDAVTWAAEKDVVNGVGDGKFAPMETITREQLAAIIQRYAPMEHIITEERADITGYADYKRVHDYARESMAWANAVGLITGKTESTLAPREGATREQFAAILRRFKEYDSYKYELVYNAPKPIGTYTEKPYELVTDADIYVAADGKDTNAGTLAAPIATFARAKEMVRELKATKTEGEIKVAFKAGTYAAPEGLAFTEEDSGSEACPITYCAYGDGEVSFTGGAVIPVDAFETLSDADKELFADTYEDSIKKVDLTRYGVDASRLNMSASVFSGSTRLDIARWPNKLASGNDDFTRLYFSVAEDESHINLMPPLVNRLKKYHNIENMYMFGYYRYDWSASDGKVIKFEPDTGKIYPTVNHYGIFNKQEADPSNRCPYFYFYNIPDELDRADEYFIDMEKGILYVMDPAEDFTICITGDMMNMNGVDYISFIGLGFSYGTGNFMIANDANHITFDRIKLSNLREKGIMITGDNNRVINSEFRDVGARNVEMISGDRETLTYGNSVIENCLFDRFGSVTKTGQPAIYVWGCGIRIAHNEISNSSNIGIMYSEYIWASNYITIEYNYLHNVVTQTSDSGAIYGGRNLSGHGTVIRYNLITNVGNRAEGHNALGIYLDDQMSGQEIYGNIFYNMANHSVFVNGGRENKIHDNIMIATTDHEKTEILIGQNHFDNHPSGTEEHVMIMELVPFRNELWASRFPNLAKMVYDMNDMTPYFEDPYCVLNPALNEVYDNVIIATERRIEGGSLLEEYYERAVRFATRLEESKVISTSENPYFVDPTHGDYSLREDADFIDIPYEKIGRY